MKIKDIVAPLEAFAPLSCQEEFDNSGLVVGRYDDEAGGALLCVDATEDVLDEAEQLGAGLIISHHPIILRPLKRFNSDGYVEQVVERAIKRDIALYACHTNLDSAPGGMSYRLAEMLGIEDPRLLEEAGATVCGGERARAGTLPPHGFGVIGTLAEPTRPLEFLRKVQRTLGVKVIRHSDIPGRIADSSGASAPAAQIRKVAICSGSGASLIPVAKAAGAELYLAADFKYNDFMAGEKNFIVADIGHFESEFCAIDLMYDVISKKIANFALHKSKSSRNPVNYLLSTR